jgi:hypothetical protein
MSDARQIVGSVMASLAMFPGVDNPTGQKVFLDSALNGLQSALDALARHGASNRAASGGVEWSGSLRVRRLRLRQDSRRGDCRLSKLSV